MVFISDLLDVSSIDHFVDGICPYYRANKKKSQIELTPSLPGDVLSSLNELLSPLKCLTSVFEMGTGVTTLLLPPDG